MKARVLAVFWFVLGACAGTGGSQGDSNLPVSREATPVEVTSQAEWTVYATGISGDRERVRQERAMLDARKAAVWFVLFGPSGLVQTAQERRLITKCQEALFAEQTVLGFVTHADEVPRERIKIEKGRKLKVRIEVRVNRQMVANWLVDHCGFSAPPLYPPAIMVLPHVAGEEDPFARLQNEPLDRHAETVLKGFLAERQYEYEEAVASTELDRTIESLGVLTGGGPKDFAYLIALGQGSDIYITFEYGFAQKRVGSTTTEKCEVTLAAFETTTGKGLGSETGYSEYLAASRRSLLEAALNNAIDGVLASVDAFWKKSLQTGVNYKAVYRIACDDFDEEDQTEVADVLIDCAKSVCQKVKPNVVTGATVELDLWATKERAEDARELERAIRKCFGEAFAEGKLQRTTLNRKLILGSIECVEDY
jgi:hypothetical protein